MKFRKKDKLIPFEKSRRVIYMEDRRPRRVYLPWLTALLFLLGSLCLLYCVGIGLFVNYGTKFFLVWGAGGAILLLLGRLIGYTDFFREMPRTFKRILCAAAGLGLLVFVFIEGLIFSAFGAQAPAGADYVIVLGAQIREDGPSYVLQKRLDAALDYLLDNPQTRVIVSGGKGAGEPMTEAQGMYDYLVSKGITGERILKEDTSRNTYENLNNSRMLLNAQECRVVVVTNNFHVFRAVGIAERMGYTQVWGQAAGSYLLMLPNNLLREFFGIVKDSLAGNL